MIIPNFDIATDIVVEFLLPDEAGNTFILGISELGGTDVLGGFGIFILGDSLLGGTDVLGTSNAFLWQPAQAVVSAVEMSVGGSVESALYFQPEAGTARLTMQSYDWDPNVNKNIRTNTAIRVRLDNGVANHTLFTGYIDVINVSYRPDGENLIQISIFDLYKQIVNTRLDTYDTTDYVVGYVTPLQAIRRAVTLAGYTVSPDSIDSSGKIPTRSETNVTANLPINEALEVGLGITWIDPETEDLVFIPRPVASSGTSTTWVISNDHVANYHLCLSDIVVVSDADAIFNSLKVTLKSDDLISVTLKDTDSIELFGESSADITLNVLNETELINWAGEVFSNTANKLVKQVETPAIDRSGNLTEASILSPGTLIGVKFTREQLAINEYYTITKVSHNIDVNNWYTTLELWKES